MLPKPFQVQLLRNHLHDRFDPLVVVNRHFRVHIGQQSGTVIGVGGRCQQRQSCLQGRLAQAQDTRIGLQVSGNHQTGQRDAAQRRHAGGHDDIFPVARCDDQRTRTQ